jgi:hypothetical protein
MIGRSPWPAVLMLIGGALIAIGPWVGRLIPLPVGPFEPVEGAWVVVVEETAARNPAVARVLADGEFWLGLESRNTKWRFYDIDSADAKPFRVEAEKVGIPAVLIVGPKGEILKSAPLPATTAGIGAFVMEATGQ